MLQLLYTLFHFSYRTVITNCSYYKLHTISLSTCCSYYTHYSTYNTEQLSHIAGITHYWYHTLRALYNYSCHTYQYSYQPRDNDDPSYRCIYCKLHNACCEEGGVQCMYCKIDLSQSSAFLIIQ